MDIIYIIFLTSFNDSDCSTVEWKNTRFFEILLRFTAANHAGLKTLQKLSFEITFPGLFDKIHGMKTASVFSMLQKN